MTYEDLKKDQTIADLKSQLKDSKSLATEFENAMKCAVKLCKEADAKNEQLTFKLKKAEETIADLQSRLDEREDQVAELSIEIGDKSVELEDLKAKLERAKADRDIEAKCADERLTEIVSLQSKLKQAEWISVGDRLPEELEPIVLFDGCTIYGGYFEGIHIRSKLPFFRDTNTRTVVNSVTHWKPITPPERTE
jgi:chromosome segregation ATPase